MVIDTHCHLNIDNTEFYFHNGHSVSSLIKGMDKNKIDKAIVCLNPKISDFVCPNDCTKNCPIYGVNHNVELCEGKNCRFEDIHTVTVEDSSNSTLILRCQKCGTIIYKGVDPLRNYNLKLLEEISRFQGRLYPMIYLHLSNSTIAQEIAFFESNFKIAGYKFHPQTNYRSMDEIKNIPTNLPIMIHTGLKTYDHPQNVINFSKRHNGPIILAHACRLDVDSLKNIATTKNLYLDVCPSDSLFKARKFAIAPSSVDKINRPDDILLYTLKYVPIDKVLFGTDYPWGSQEIECSIIQSLSLSESEKNKILFENVSKIYSIE